MNIKHTLSAISLALSIGVSLALSIAATGAHASSTQRSQTEQGRVTASGVAVGPQYDTTHVYVAFDDLDKFVDSFVATLDGHPSQRGVFQVTPTPSETASQYIQTPVGMLSVFGFKTPVPYPFGLERTGYLVTDIDAAVEQARAAGAEVIVEPFDDPIGKDALIQFPGGVKMQLYWHTKAPNYAPLQTIPENRVYVSRYTADAFVRSFIKFSKGHVVTDDRHADAGQIGKPDTAVRRVDIASPFGKMAVFVTDGKLPYPFGHEVTGYEVENVDATIAKGAAHGVTVLSQPYALTSGRSAVIEFPGGYIAEIHDRTPR